MYEKIKKILSTGEHELVENDYKEYKVISRGRNKKVYELIKKILSTREHVLVKNGDGFYNVLSASRSGDFIYRNREWYKEGDGAARYESNREFLSQKEIDNWQIIDVFDTPKERFKVGDEVVVTEGGFKRGLGDIVDALGNSYLVRFKGKSGKFEFYQHELSYPFKEEQEKKQDFENRKRSRIYCL